MLRKIFWHKMAPENEQFRISNNEELHDLCFIILRPQKEVIDVSPLNILKLSCFPLQYTSPQLSSHYVQRNSGSDNIH
jgi:hypothetical protein